MQKLMFVLIALFVALPAHAGESLFSRAYTTETVPEGHFELEQTVRERSHRSYGVYEATDLMSELEYGVTDQFQTALYINSGYLHAKDAPDDNDPDFNEQNHHLNRNNFALQSIEAEFLYRFISPVGHPIGIAVAIEPELQFDDLHNGHTERGSFEQEFRLIFQKNFLDDQLILVWNTVADFEYFHYSTIDQNDPNGTPYLGEFDWNNEVGLSYRVASNWYGGLEFRNHNEMGMFWHHDHSVYWVGPAAHYAMQRFWVTLGLLYQVYGDPNGKADADPDGGTIQNGDGTHFLHSHELWETTLKVSWAF